MCGICGVIGMESQEAGEAAARRMLASIVHRGPDDEGLLAAPSIVAGSRRLSIIDIPGGSQPVWNEAGTLAVVYNGEIYNFRELRSELESAGHAFRTRSDTEVIVHAYEAWGEGCVARFHGMFAFAVVEMPQGPQAPPARVFLARDPLGIKPLYYAKNGPHFLFASEVRALLASGHVRGHLSAEAVPSYLLFGSVGEPLSLVEGVLSIPPGHTLTIPVDNKEFTPRPVRYWKIEEAIAQHTSHGSVRPGAAIRPLLESAVASHLVSDVPVGVFLSSGLDSTVIAALASRAQRGIHTFTVVFPDVEFSEAGLASATAKRLGTVHQELEVSDEDMLARLDDAVASFDQPSMDGINTYFVSWAARMAGLKVALSGLGSDEIFGGYSSFEASRKLARISRWARVVPRPLRTFSAHRIRRARSFRGSPDSIRKAMAPWVDPSILPHPYFFSRTLFTPQTVASGWVSHAAASDWSGTAWHEWLARAVSESQTMDDFTGVSWLELRSYLVNTLLRDTDVMSMRHSLEVRVPFLDTPLVEAVLALPESAKYRPARPKALLVEAVRDLLPREILRQKKRTFTFPWENWLRGPLGNRIASGLAEWSPTLEPHFNRSLVQGVWKDFQRGRTSWSRPWSLYVLNEWVKRHLRADSTGSAPANQTSAVSAA
jgi:asparagine synthase (glutamine-hydrolysing)